MEDSSDVNYDLNNGVNSDVNENVNKNGSLSENGNESGRGSKVESRNGSGVASRKGSKNGSKNISEHDLNIENESNIEHKGAEYIPDLHGAGKERQAITSMVQDIGIPGQVAPYHAPYDDLNSEKATVYDENGLPITNNSNNTKDEKKLWSWTSEGKLKLSCSQPIIPVSVVQGILRRDKIILIPQVEVTDVIVPKIYNQNIKHDVPKLDIKVENAHVKIPNVKYVDKEIIIPIITGYTHKFVPKWEIHEVPRPIVKYIGEQKIVEVEVPEIKYVDKIVEREVVVDTIEKRVPKIIEIPKYVDEVQYVWKPIEKIVYVQKLVPKFDVNLECPPPLIVPYPVQTVRQIPPVMIKKDTIIPEYQHYDLNSPEGSVPIPEEYIKHYSRKQNIPKVCFSSCCESNVKNEENENECIDVFPSYIKRNSSASFDNILNVPSDSKFPINDNTHILNESEQHIVDVNA
ncbi:inner membrane complex protein 1k, putative [Plasmodium relictum]|uniref:Inner membrane complex protein 1k, putative n=1 Tax=Plasmodium relictum TaxID=85471 RepID=A0A1J1H9M1_PLARL|nr:inner membrane complex protein 1k, putative [Plasmodium relictum]CRH01674.1 inner membrane complex protein 1k, putative [Plasmodium relictum]